MYLMIEGRATCEPSDNPLLQKIDAGKIAIKSLSFEYTLYSEATFFIILQKKVWELVWMSNSVNRVNYSLINFFTSIRRGENTVKLL